MRKNNYIFGYILSQDEIVSKLLRAEKIRLFKKIYRFKVSIWTKHSDKFFLSVENALK